ncbi:MAG: 3-methyl-2-oxobutanoate hydroxymethyltransferase [Candidatus Pelagibacter sp. TMED64]|nr:3-methyl-2-oxobutanoate hydroxymethyltransferase [Candidatus Pelagibacter sp.]OUU67308.1 MAG: 3-methyl-2-oxobutanoate hydroxymethyltransferase [Candidatus Pelagibacter sp. TMED64]|tara:strand:- start:11535 stop:12314 length:780 start_codon:yes stop_codon:yes gene_type:complete
MNKKIKKILEMKNKKKITCLTSYTTGIASIVDKYCDIILVGDSLGMVLYGNKNTRLVNLDTMILHGKSVVKAAKKSLVVIDMPFGTYDNKFIAYKNAKKIITKTKCDAVKLEGGKNIYEIVKYLISKKISVMGHIGLLPQFTKAGFKIQGRNIKQQKKLLTDAESLSKAGAFSIVIECVMESLARKISKKISIPTIGIGASKECDGQILVIDDIIGLSSFYPKFVKKYSNVAAIIEKSVKKYCIEVKNNKFPGKKHTYV